MTHIKVELRGGYADAINSEEEWQTGFHLWIDNSVPDDTGSFPDQTIDPEYSTGSGSAGSFAFNWEANWVVAGLLDPGDFFDNVMPPIATFFGATGLISSHVTLREVRMYWLNALGSAVLVDGVAARGIATVPGTVVGGATGAMVPLEVSTVVSLTAFRGGPRGKGRMYLPPGAVGALDTNGRYTSTYTNLASEAAAALLSGVSEESVSPTGLHSRPVVTGPSGPDLYSVVRQVRVGDVPDSQRRRRNRLMETYDATDVVYG